MHVWWKSSEINLVLYVNTSNYCLFLWLPLSPLQHSRYGANILLVFFAKPERAWAWVQPVSKTHWATMRRQAPLSTESCCASSQVMPMSFRSRCTVSVRFFRGLPGFLFISLEPQNMACLGSLLSSIRKTCPSHLSLLSSMISSIFSNCVSSLTLSLLTKKTKKKTNIHSQAENATIG